MKVWRTKKNLLFFLRTKRNEQGGYNNYLFASIIMCARKILRGADIKTPLSYMQRRMYVKHIQVKQEISGEGLVSTYYHPSIVVLYIDNYYNGPFDIFHIYGNPIVKITAPWIWVGRKKIKLFAKGGRPIHTILIEIIK